MGVNFRSFVKMYETKYKKSQQVERAYKESLIENVEQKKALVKKNIDLSQVSRGIPLLDTSPMAVFMREMAQERAKL